MGLMKKLTSAIVASSLVFSLAGSAFAAYTPAAGETAGNRMMGLQILKGKYENDPLALKDEISRAELVTVIVRAFGKEADAALLNGAAAFPDTASHWASGNIAMAKALVEKAGGDAIGMPDGSFSPDGKLTPAQAVAFLMKFLGVKADANKAWPANYLDKAVELNLITAEDNALIAPMLNDNATRGLVFYLFDRAFYNYDLGAGKTFYTKFVDTTAPVVTLNAVEPTTLDSKVTISGKVEGATEAYVGTKSITVDANGNFSVDYELPELKEYNIAVTARDLAGNTSEKAVAVTRTTGNAAAIEAAAITVAAGQTVDVAAIVKDAKGNALTGVTVSGESTVGTYEAGKFTAGKTAGTGTLTLKAGEATAKVDVTVTAGALAAVTTSAQSVKVGEKVTLTATDEFGNAISGVSFTNDSADAFLDSAKGVFVASAEGTYTVTASKDGKTATATIGVYKSEVAKLVVVAPTTAIGNSEDTTSENGTLGEQDDYDYVGTTYEVVVKAVDENGNLVANYEGNIDLTIDDTAFFAGKDADATVTDNVISKAAENGVATFKVLAKTGTDGYKYDFTAETEVDGNTIGDGTGELTKGSTEVVEQVATSVKISTSATAKYIRSNEAGNTTSAKVYVADQDGKRLLDATVGYDIALTMTGAATLGVQADDVTGKTSYTATYNGASVVVDFESIKAQTGTATLTATSEGLGSATASVTAAVAAKAAKVNLSVDDTTAVANDKDTREYTIQVTDANGVPVEGTYVLDGTFNYEIDEDAPELALNATTGSIETALAPNPDDETSEFQIETNGQGKAVFELQAGAFTGDLKLTLTDNVDDAYDLASANTTVTFKADAPVYVGLTRSSEIHVSGQAPTATLTAQLYDGSYNKAAVAGKKVSFTVAVKSGDGSESDVTLNGTAKKVEVLTDAQGKATVDAKVVGYPTDAYTVTVDSPESAIGQRADNAYKAIDLVVVNAVANKVTYTVTDENGEKLATKPAAGTVLTLTVTVKDANDRPIDGDSVWFYPTGKAYLAVDANDVAFDIADSDTWSKISTTDGVKLAAGTDAGTYTLQFVAGASGSFGFTLKDKSTGVALEQAGSVAVKAAPAAKLVLNGGDKVTVEEGKASSAVTLKLTDAFGNTVNASKALTVTFDAGYGVRTSTAAPDTDELTIKAGTNSTSFYLWSNKDAGSYTVNFSATDGTNTYNGALSLEIK